MNKIFLKGFLGQDPTIRSFEWGKTASVNLATDETYKNKKGEKVTETEWHALVFRGPVVDIVEKHLHKGSEILVIGKKRTREYEDKDKIKRSICEIIVDHFEFCGSKKDSGIQANSEWQGKTEQKKEEPKPELASGSEGFPDMPPDLDDLPF